MMRGPTSKLEMIVMRIAYGSHPMCSLNFTCTTAYLEQMKGMYMHCALAYVMLHATKISRSTETLQASESIKTHPKNMTRLTIYWPLQTDFAQHPPHHSKYCYTSLTRQC